MTGAQYDTASNCLTFETHNANDTVFPVVLWSVSFLCWISFLWWTGLEVFSASALEYGCPGLARGHEPLEFLFPIHRRLSRVKVGAYDAA